MKRWFVLCLFVLAMPATAAAQEWEDYDYENLQFRGLGIEFGGIWPSRVEQTTSLGLRADLGFVGPHVRIVPAIRYWTSALRQTEVDRLAEQILRICQRQEEATCPEALDLGMVRRSDLELSADAHYLFPTGYAIEPYLGGGGSLHLLNGRGEFIDDTFIEDLLDTLAPGVHLVAGLNLPVGQSLSFVTEARFVLASDLHYANFLVGGTWILPSPTGGSNPGAAR